MVLKARRDRPLPIFFAGEGSDSDRQNSAALNLRQSPNPLKRRYQDAASNAFNRLFEQVITLALADHQRERWVLMSRILCQVSTHLFSG